MEGRLLNNSDEQLTGLSALTAVVEAGTLPPAAEEIKVLRQEFSQSHCSSEE